ncbi:hypothetical protein D3C85_1865300 [compost metagenome]
MQRRDLLERVELLKRVGRFWRCLNVNESVRNLAELKCSLNRRRTGILMAVELVHKRLLAGRVSLDASYPV